jgi:hypothetical protein
MEPSPSWEVANFAATQELPAGLTKLHYVRVRPAGLRLASLVYDVTEIKMNVISILLKNVLFDNISVSIQYYELK